MVRLPRGWVLHQPAGSQPARTGSVTSRVEPTPQHRYTRLLNTDIGNDGIAPVATFTAAGTAQAQAGPSGVGQSWALDQAFLSTSAGAFDPAECSLYVGPLPLQTYLIVSSLAGGGSQFGLGGVGLAPGWFVYAVWTGGTQGVSATLRVTGTKQTLVVPW
jgi:hypothetical protein